MADFLGGGGAPLAPAFWAPACD